MRFISAIIVFLLLVPFSYGQLTVKPTSPQNDSYLYVDGTLLFVNQSVNLQKNADASATEASIYFRNDGQLIQGESGTAPNKGNGLVSIFQEGTSNAYDYNYWSAPVSDASTVNALFGIELLYTPVTQTKSLQALKTSALDGMADPLTISAQWIYMYSGTRYSNWKGVFGETIIPAGWGFSMKGVNGKDLRLIDGRPNNPGNSQRYDFRGRPNNGAIAVPVSPGAHILAGNPYPSALDLSLFLLENSGSGVLNTACYGDIHRSPSISGIAYFWDSIANGDSHYLQDYFGGYGIFSPVDPCTTGIYEKPIFRKYTHSKGDEPETTGKHYDRRFLPIAQGFMVEGLAEGELVFENHHRVFRKEGDYSDFKTRLLDEGEDGLSVIPKIRLEADIDDSYTRSFTLAFWDSATPGADVGMDAKSFGTAPTDIGWQHQNENYTIDVRPFNELDEIPLYIKVEEPEARIVLRVSQLEHISLKNIYILDKAYGLYYPIRAQNFQILLKKGEYPDRFKLCFRDSSPVPPVEELVEGLHIFQNNPLGQLEIRTDDSLPIQSVSLFDLLGKKLFSIENIPANFQAISTASFANSLYIVKVLLKDRREYSKKISIRQLH